MGELYFPEREIESKTNRRDSSSTSGQQQPLVHMGLYSLTMFQGQELCHAPCYAVMPDPVPLLSIYR